MQVSSVNSMTNISSNTNYQNRSYKAQPYKNHIDISFNEADMECGSIISALTAFGAAGVYLTKTKEKNLAKAGVISAAIFTAVSLAVMGGMSFIKVIKKTNESKKIANQGQI